MHKNGWKADENKAVEDERDISAKRLQAWSRRARPSTRPQSRESGKTRKRAKTTSATTCRKTANLVGYTLRRKGDAGTVKLPEILALFPHLLMQNKTPKRIPPQTTIQETPDAKTPKTKAVKLPDIIQLKPPKASKASYIEARRILRVAAWARKQAVGHTNEGENGRKKAKNEARAGFGDVNGDICPETAVYSRDSLSTASMCVGLDVERGVVGEVEAVNGEVDGEVVEEADKEVIGSVVDAVNGEVDGDVGGDAGSAGGAVRPWSAEYVGWDNKRELLSEFVERRRRGLVEYLGMELGDDVGLVEGDGRMVRRADVGAQTLHRRAEQKRRDKLAVYFSDLYREDSPVERDVNVSVGSEDEEHLVVPLELSRGITGAGGLTLPQVKALVLLVEGRPVRYIASRIGVSEGVLRGWMRSDGPFLDELERLKDEFYVMGVQQALSVLRRHIKSGSKLEQWRAANSILRHHALLEMRKSHRTIEFKGVEKLRAMVRELDGRVSPSMEDEIEEAEYVQLVASDEADASVDAIEDSASDSGEPGEVAEDE